MFAASVPISLAGWGVREMSAVAALGFIGVSGPAAFTTAVIVGVGSLASMAIIAAASLPGRAAAGQASKAEDSRIAAPVPGPSIDYARALAWALPLAAATLVLFQIYVPMGSGILNVNLADPVALIAASLFILSAIVTRHMPQWRMPGFNIAVGLATAALTVSLLIGIGTFGVTTWAWVNRYLGWFVLLAYGATGALIVQKGGKDALRILLLSYVGATIAVAVLDLGLVFLKVLGFDFTRKIDIEGFSQNHNFFAFQLLMATTAMLVFVKRRYLRLALISIAMVAFWFAGSRSGWIAAVAVLGTGI
jgi:hypothetical protein